MRIILLSCFAVMTLLGFSSLSVAQNQTPAPGTAAPIREPNLSMPPMQDSEVTILRDNYSGKYNLSTIENLSKLYWRLGAFDLEDDTAIANFLRINECSMYSEYLNDDLEWQQILKTMREHLAKNKDTYPLNYQFVLPLHLGRYDPVQQGFPLVDHTGFEDSKRIEVQSNDQEKEICHSKSATPDYPLGIVILLPQPFTMNFVKLDEHVAQAFILRKKADYLKLDEGQRLKSHEREAFLRLRVTFSQYNGNLRGTDNQIMAILFGQIDGYEIFEDYAQKRLMLSVDLKNQQTSNAPHEEPQSFEMSTPAAPSMPPQEGDIIRQQGGASSVSFAP